MIRSRITRVAGALLIVLGLCLVPRQSAEPSRTIEIDLDRAVVIELPEFRAFLQPVALKTPDGKDGWAVRIPGNSPVATPAYAGGRLYAGGGFGSHEFYCFSAKTGALVWKIRTEDDGPSAAVVADGWYAWGGNAQHNKN